MRHTLWNSKYIDLHSLPHFMFGVVFAQISRAFSIDILITATAMIVVAILWEFLEVIKNIPEERTNGIVDVLLSICGFVLMLWAVPIFAQSIEIGVFWWVLAIWAALNIVLTLSGGWRSWIQPRNK